MDKNAAISSFFYSYFGTVDKEIRCHLEKICYFTTRDKKEILFYEGQEGNNIYFLASGNVKLFRTDVEGKERSTPIIGNPNDSDLSGHEHELVRHSRW